jgi:hypothetical protein
MEMLKNASKLQLGSLIESSSGFNLKKEMEILSQIEKELKEKPELVVVRRSVIEEATPKQEDEDEDEVLIEEKKLQQISEKKKKSTKEDNELERLQA